MRIDVENNIATATENEDLHSMKLKYGHASFETKIDRFNEFIGGLTKSKRLSYFRKICSPMDRVVSISLNGADPRDLVMFGSNNYLGFANDQYIRQKVKEHIDENGIGVAGPPILNGYTKHHDALEKRLAAFKGVEDAMLFASGFQTNLGLISSLVSNHDVIFCDQYSHASTFDGLKLTDVSAIKFRHNDINMLSRLINNSESKGQKFIAVEGLYSMDGDICPLDKVLEIARSSNSICLLDDSHGTGLLGRNGKGTIELFKVPEANIVHMGTFSKTFAVNGGFIAGNRDLINYLRYHARSYLFSASLSNIMVAAIHAGLDLIENEPWRRARIIQLKEYAIGCLSKFEFVRDPASAIIALKIPNHVNIREACIELHEIGFFVNGVEYPAVPKNQERIRISLMVNHQEEDIRGLVNALERVFNKPEWL